MKRVEAEAEYNIKRLRNHASMAMWCGNNEIYEGMSYWGWDKKYTDPVSYTHLLYPKWWRMYAQKGKN